MENENMESAMEMTGSGNGKKVLTAQEVGERMRISLSTVHHLTRIGKIKAVKIGKQWRYAAEDVEGYLTGGFEIRKSIEERRKADRRICPRINCFIQGRAKIALAPIRYWEGDGAAMNLSEGGLLFVLAEPPQSADAICTDDPVSLALYFPAQFRRELALEGRIVYFQSENKTRLGIKFRGLAPEVQKAIHEYIG